MTELTFNTTIATLDGEGTLLREVVTVTAPLFLKKFTYRQARESHEKIFERVKAYLETV